MRNGLLPKPSPTPQATPAGRLWEQRDLQSAPAASLHGRFLCSHYKPVRTRTTSLTHSAPFCCPALS